LVLVPKLKVCFLVLQICKMLLLVPQHNFGRLKFVRSNPSGLRITFYKFEVLKKKFQLGDQNQNFLRFERQNIFKPYIFISI